MKAADEMTVAELRAVPLLPRMEDVLCRTVIIVPTEELHDSGWRSMEFILENEKGEVGRVGGWSDALHIEGIGSALYLNKRGAGWTIDCTPSGFLRLFRLGHGLIRVRLPALSSFEIFAEGDS